MFYIYLALATLLMVAGCASAMAMLYLIVLFDSVYVGSAVALAGSITGQLLAFQCMVRAEAHL